MVTQCNALPFGSVWVWCDRNQTRGTKLVHAATMSCSTGACPPNAADMNPHGPPPKPAKTILEYLRLELHAFRGGPRQWWNAAMRNPVSRAFAGTSITAGAMLGFVQSMTADEEEEQYDNVDVVRAIAGGALAGAALAPLAVLRGRVLVAYRGGDLELIKRAHHSAFYLGMRAPTELIGALAISHMVVTHGFLTGSFLAMPATGMATLLACQGAWPAGYCIFRVAIGKLSEDHFGKADQAWVDAEIKRKRSHQWPSDVPR